VRPVDDILILELEPEAAFETLRDSIRDLLGKENAATRGKDARLDLKSRHIDLFNLRRLVHLLLDECAITVTGIYCSENALQRYAEGELKLKIYTSPPLAETPQETDETEAPETGDLDDEPDTENVEIAFDPRAKPTTGSEQNLDGRSQPLLTVTRSLRSGQLVRTAGDVAIYGDIHPGAEVIAGGNIMIFGSLMGMAHAGSRGDESAIVLALDFRPIQLRVGRKIGVPPENPIPTSTQKWSPEIAWVEGGEVRVAPYQGHLPS
jgi:septum site-determining protein MinC